MKNILAVAFVVSVASVALSQVTPPAAPPAGNAELLQGLGGGLAAPGGGGGPGLVVVPAKTQKWEYKVSDRGGFEPGAWQKKLNDLAAEGWELDAIDEGHYILRRPVQVGIPAGAFGRR